MSEIIVRFLKVIMFFEVITLAYSLFCCVTTDKVFSKNFKNKNLSFIPVYNLIVLIDIVKLNRAMAVLLFVPVTNVIVFILISYRLSIMFNLSKAFTILLILFPIVMLPVLNYIKINSIEVEKEFDDVSGEMVTLLTESEMNSLNEAADEEVKVDNEFKAETSKPKEEVPVFKAGQYDYKNNSPIYNKAINDYKEDEVERVEVTEIIPEIPTNKIEETNRFVSSKVTEEAKEEDKDIEYLNF